MTGIQEPNSQDLISDSTPGNSERVTKYAIIIDNICGQISFETSIRDAMPALMIEIQFSQDFL
jgi:hypothetical protein